MMYVCLISRIFKSTLICTQDDVELKPEFFKDIHCLLVDEAQFLSARHIDSFRAIADAGCPVICYGLRTDFRTRVFEGSLRLLELSDTIEEVKTTCYDCNKKAVFNVKLVDGKGTLSGAQVELGCEETYHPVCSNHYKMLTRDCAESKDQHFYSPKLSFGAEIKPPTSVAGSVEKSAEAIRLFREAVNVHNKDAMEAMAKKIQEAEDEKAQL
jgi:hypothetical protein